MRLTIVIPAYNEEAAIAQIITRCLKAEPMICSSAAVDSVQVIVVSDGSTDRTAKIARGYPQVRLIEFPENRGYGAAIKRGFAEGRGELVAFLDADGTCDPRFFGLLCDALVREGADIAVGSRMGSDSRMPRVRRLGNTVFALLLGALSNRAVSDTASGMRVLRREALELLYPLPDGLNFTPAMSAQALLDDRISIIELPMKYEERVGRSKLSVVKDGLRFFGAIMEAVLVWRPSRLFVSGGLLFGLLALLLIMGPAEEYLRQRIVREGMIYRLLFCSLLMTLAATLLSVSLVAERLSRSLLGRRGAQSFVESMLSKLLSWRGLMVVGSGLMLIAFVLVGPGLLEYAMTRHVTLHWSRIVLGGAAVFCAAQMAIGAALAHMAQVCIRRQAHREAAGAKAQQECSPFKRQAESGEKPEPVGDEHVLV
ncbi:MAG: glycosyltransferase family 2 protein [Phycisphaerales bacterium]|nr:MAG: glycosyltransferase family 2 protein [Phycisphaerales bacterium]